MRLTALLVSACLILTSPGYAAFKAAGEVIHTPGQAVSLPAVPVLPNALPGVSLPVQALSIQPIQAVPQAQPVASQALEAAAQTGIQITAHEQAYSPDSASRAVDFASGKVEAHELSTPVMPEAAASETGTGLMRTTAGGQLKSAVVSGAAAGLLGYIGLSQQHPAAHWPALGAAALTALASTAYTILGLRLFSAARKVEPRVVPALDLTAATQEGRAAHIEGLPARALKVVDAHEDAHRRGLGEAGAYASQLSVFPRFLLDEVRGLVSSGVEKTVAGLKVAREMTFGDPSIAQYMGKERGAMRLVRGLFVADAVLNTTMGFLVGPLLDTARLAGKTGVSAQSGHLILYSSLMLGSFLVYTFIERAHVYAKRALTLRATRDFRVALKEKLVAQEMDFHLENGSAALASRVRDDTNYLTLKAIDVPLDVLIYGLYFAFGVGMMFWVHPGLAAIVLAAIPVFGFLTGRIGQKLIDVSFETGNTKAELTRHAQEVLQQAQTVKSFATADAEVARYAAKADGVKALGETEAKLNAAYGLVGSLKDFFTKNLVYILGAWVLGLSMGLSFGQVTSMTMFAGFASAGLGGLFSAYMMFQKYRGNSKVVQDLLARKPAIVDAPDAVKVAEVDGGVRFENVDFSYPNRPEAGKVLNGLNLEIKPGQTVALVGETGSGKSTIAKLVLRLWEPTAGRVLIDGKDLKTLDRRTFLSNVAVVPQDTRLFTGSIRDNMLYGADDVGEDQLKEAIKMAAAEFVFDPERFPKGLDTSVAEGGSRLSGGERQRVAIVRALLRKPSLLVLDEATSALDNESEKIVQSALDRLVQGGVDKTGKPSTIVIAHRLSTIRGADKIVFLAKGKVVESGTHDELLALDGNYARLWKQGLSSDNAPPRKKEPKASALGQFAASGVFFSAAAALLAHGGVALAAAAALMIPGLAFAIAGVRIGRALKSLTAAIATPESRSEAFKGLPRAVRGFIDLHEAAHKDRGVGEVRAHIAQLPDSLKVIGGEVRRLLIPVRKFVRDAKKMVMGDEVVAPILAPQKGALRTSIALLITQSLLAVGGSYALGRLLDASQTVQATGKTAPLVILSAVVAVGFLAQAFVSRASVRISGTLKARLTRDLRVALMKKLLGFEMSFLMAEESGALASRLADDAEALSGKNTTVRLPLLQNTIALVLSVGFLASVSWAAALIILAVLPIIGGINGMLGQKSERNYQTFSQRRAELGRSAQETFEQIQTVKTFGREKEAVEKYASRAGALVETGVEGGKIMANTHMFSSSITQFFTRDLIYVAGAWVVALSAGFTLGQIAAMTFYAAFIKASFDGLAAGWMEFKQAHGETRVLRDWLTRGPKIKDGAEVIADASGTVGFQGVTFRYEGSENVLKNVTFEAKPGETIAFVGGSGSGKSTIMKLLQRLWEPQEGKITIDGVDVKDATLESVARSIAVVPQDTRLFDDTIRFNMTYGMPGVTDEQLAAAVRMARAQFVDDKGAFPEGLETKVGEGGAKLSGGQRQRVAIVRAILKKAPILILDEATSALDKQTEREIQETLDSLVSGKAGLSKPTTLVVAHNLTTTMKADRIYVLELGRVVETGTHAELLERGGAYARLWAASQKQK